MYSKKDPRSWDYERTYTRPDIHLVRVFMYILIFAGLIVLEYMLLDRVIGCKGWIKAISCIAFAIIFILIHLRRIMIWMVKAYQHFAPIRVRRMCRFEPSCSCYMITSLEKYGAIKGVRKGYDRIYRCSHGDGGFDEP